MKKLIFILFLVAVGGILSGCQETVKPAAQPVATTSHGKLTLDQIGEIQPGFGVIMMEMGERFTIAGYAGKAGNWDLVDYELKEIGEAAAVGMTTRPKRQAALETFLEGSFAKLKKAAEKKDVAEFEAAFDKAVKSCNGCHAAQDMAFIKYQLPTTQPESLIISPE